MLNLMHHYFLFEGVEIVLISADTYLSTGDTAILVCVTSGQANEEIEWIHNDQSVLNSSLVTIYEEEVIQGGRLFRQSFLQLCSLSESNTGDYTCVVSNGQTTASNTVQLTVSVSG